MAKLKSPLMSFSAHGALGDLLVFFDRHGKSYVRSKPQDPISLSVDQGVLRDCFVSAAVSAHSLTQGQKDYYADLAPNSAFCPWWNNFIGQYIKDNYEVPGVATTFLKSLQVAVVTILSGNSYVDAPINTIVQANAAPFLLGNEARNTNPQNFGCYLNFTSPTNVRVVRHWTPMTGDLTVSIMVIEFEGDFVVASQNVQVNFGAGDTEANTVIPAVDLSKTILFPRGFVTVDNVAPTIYQAYSDFEDNTHVRARRNTSGNVVYVMTRFIQFI